MPSLEVADLPQTAVLWSLIGYDAYGQGVIGSAKELSPPNGIRWIQQRRESLDKEGNSIVLDATIMSAQLIPIGSLMWLGTLANWSLSGSTQSGDQPELHEVKTSQTTPDIKGRDNRYSYGLMRYRGKLPT